MSRPPAGFQLEGVGLTLGGSAVLEGVELSIAAGDVLAVIGPSGAGKTSLLRLLNRTVRPSLGTVSMDGRDLASLDGPGLRRTRSEVGFVHQEHCLVPNLRVVQNVLAGRLGRFGLWGALRRLVWPGSLELEAVHALLERVGIADKLFERTSSLSGGERQRVALARALFQEPRALVADEPVAALDPARSRSIIELLGRVAREEGLTLVCGMHDLTLAREYFPRCVGLRQGRVVFDGPTAQIASASFEDLYRLEEREESSD